MPAATALDFGFTLGNKYALWVPDVETAPVLKARPVAGGADIDLGAASVFLGKIDGSDKLIAGYNQRDIMVSGQPVTVVDFELLDPANEHAGDTCQWHRVEIGAVVVPGGKLMAYTEADKGLFILDIP